MAIFFLVYGLIEIINSIYVYGAKREWFNLSATAFWGATFIFVGLVEIIPTNNLKDFAYLLFGLSWFPMMFTPCAIKFFRKNNRTLLLRKIFFFLIGVTEIIIILLK